MAVQRVEGVLELFSFKRIIADLVMFGRGYLRNRVGLFFGLIFPVILIFVFGAIFSGGFSGPINVYAQNRDNGQVSVTFINALNGTGTIRLAPVNASDNFSEYLSVHSSSDGIIIPEDFSLSYIAGRAVNITVYGNPSSSSSAVVIGTVSGVANAFNLKRVGGASVIGVSQTTVNTQVSKYIDFLIPGLLGFSILVSPMFSLVNISSEYKKIKLFKQLSLTPLMKTEWLISKVLWYIFLTTLSFLLMVAVGVLVFGAHILLSPWLIPFLILGPMFFASLGMLVGTITKSPETAAVIGNVVTFPMMFLSGTFFPVAMMPPYLQQIAHVLPLFYIIEGINAVMVYSNYTQAAMDLAIITVITIIVFVTAARLFKWRED
ncbi:ABC transporter permease [Candidatus Bathyarchaeota archaeon]|nr:ABC transporter permease [Candidatus Bathyarchaeota archaeon]